MKKILHITNWYPNKWDDLDGIFIKEQFKVFSEVTKSHLLHVQVRKGDKFLQYMHINYSSLEEGYYFLTKFKSNKIIELLTTILLLWALLKSNYKKYDLLHFHIAYPLLIHYHIWKRIIKTPVILSEHWSAYHFNFYMPKDTKKLDRIKRIFKQNIPLLIVSKALYNDIVNFSGSTKIFYQVIPNIIKEKIFFYQKEPESSIPVFFIVNEWSEVKNPFPMLEAFLQIKVPYCLKIGGYGKLYPEIKKFVHNNNMSRNVIFLDKMKAHEIANTLNTSHGYLFASKYETFSIICAEALSCGCPLLGPRLEAINEYTDETNSILFDENCVESWKKYIELFIQKRINFNRKEISQNAKQIFSQKNIKASYLEFLQKVENIDK